MSLSIPVVDFRTVDGSDSQLSLNSGDNRGSLEQSSGQSIEGLLDLRKSEVITGVESGRGKRILMVMRMKEKLKNDSLRIVY